MISFVENYEAASRIAISELFADTGNAHIIGVTGPPGSGKSTLVNEIAKAFRRREFLVGILAVDPSSPFSGGAILGDRVRMQDLSGDKGIFIRSMASRGSLGGLARMTGDVVKIIDAAGFDIILVETVGAGQAEVDIANTAHTTLVVEAPGMGDEIQTIKAGILEIADILVVNKADKPGSDRAITGLRVMLNLGGAAGPVRHHGQLMMSQDEHPPAESQTKSWEVTVLPTVAITGEGIEKLVVQIQAHRTYLKESGEWYERELTRSRQEIGKILHEEFLRQMNDVVLQNDRDALVEAVAERKIDPYTAVDRLFAKADEKGLLPQRIGQR
jgi:LAO/AO transport system kinase